MPASLLRLVVAAGLAFALLAPGAAQETGDARVERLMAVLVAAYPDFLAGYDGNALVWKDGTRMGLDDKGPKDFATLLAAPDIKDMFYAAYPPGRSGLSPAVNSDPGRVRFQPLFDKMYGACTRGEVAGHLVDVIWLRSRGGGQVLKATRINDVAAKLQAVSDELDRLPAKFTKFLVPSAGTYDCRPIAGTRRISAHGSGIAIDIATAHSHYWFWTKPGPDGRYPYKNRVPWEIVEIFERHGFIWGGKWYHYDTMHFEYRPEILGASK